MPYYHAVVLKKEYADVRLSEVLSVDYKQRSSKEVNIQADAKAFNEKLIVEMIKSIKSKGVDVDEFISDMDEINDFAKQKMKKYFKEGECPQL